MGAEPTAGQRPMRADARRNYDRLVVAAREAFRENGTETTFEGIARRAGVGIGTLYRHFPTRLALAETVYRADVDELSVAAKEAVGELPAWEALTTWTSRWVDTAATKRVIFAELAEAVGKDSELVSHCRWTMLDAAKMVLANAQRAGVARTDVDEQDMLRLVSGLVHVPSPDPDQIARLLPVLLDGLRAQA